MSKQIWIGCDHGGYEVKLPIINYLKQEGYEVTDVGCDSIDIVRYPYYAARVASAVSSGLTEQGILICSTGIGMSIIANKYKNVRASVCTSHYMAEKTREHNNSNVLCLGGKILGIFEIMDILQTWLKTAYIGGRHQISLDMIKEAENKMIFDEVWYPKTQQ